jgi:hypothetical protein
MEIKGIQMEEIKSQISRKFSRKITALRKFATNAIGSICATVASVCYAKMAYYATSFGGF